MESGRQNRFLQEKRIFPAIDILKSGTRREEMLLSEEEQKANWNIRKTMSKDGQEGYIRLLQLLKATKSNDDLVHFVNKKNDSF